MRKDGVSYRSARRVRVLAGFAGAAQRPSASPARALLDDKFVVNLGALVVGSDFTARLNGSSTTNPDIDFDETFGKAQRRHQDSRRRVLAHHSGAPSALPLLRQQHHPLARHRPGHRLGRQRFHAGGLVKPRRFKLFELAYEYAFIRQPTFELTAASACTGWT